ncbi:hypothetical protein GGS21DRAFT_514260 [Xylaria nigripes]|nr:hypothetical protein GGS21DRAFT_514260 [Xylaria nigripes]
MSTIYSMPRDKPYGKYKKVLYLEPPFDGAVTVKRRVTTVIPPAPLPPVSRNVPASVLHKPKHTPRTIQAVPPLPRAPPMTPILEREDSPIDIIAVDVDPSETASTKSSRTSKSHRSSRSSKSHSHSRGREVYIERERVVPIRVAVPYPVAEPQYDTYRYVEAPPRYEPRRRSPDREIVIDDHRRQRCFRV